MNILIKTLHRPLFICLLPKCHVRDMHLYLGAGWRNWSQSFGKWQVWSLATYWNLFGFLISIAGVRNLLQSQEGVPDFFKKMYHIFKCFSVFWRVWQLLFLFFSFPFLEKVTSKILEFVLIIFFLHIHIFGAVQNRGKVPDQGAKPKISLGLPPAGPRMKGA